jgi:phytoene dehydrogenase-like protein
LASVFKKSQSPTQPLSDLAKHAKSERWPVWSLTGGLQTLPNALAEKAKQAGVEVCLEAPCTGV